MEKSLKDTLNTLQAIKKLAEDTSSAYDILYQDLGLTHFAYLRYYKDGHYLHLCDNANWVKARIENNFNLNTTPDVGEKCSLPTHMQTVLLTGTPKNKMHKLLFDMNIWNGCVLYNVLDDYIEVWGFASKRNDVQKIGFYINNMDLLKRFTFFYKSKFDKLITTQNPECLLFDPKLKEFFDIVSHKQNTSSSKFISHTPIDTYIFDKNVRFSKKEYMCLLNISKGMSAKSTAHLLGLSSRTVESYIEHLKCKFNCAHKEQLIDLFLKYHDGFLTHGDIYASS